MGAFLCAVKCLFLYEYLCSGTPLYRHPWKAAIYNIADTSLALNVFTYVCVQSNVEICKWTGSAVPTVPELYKIYSIMQALKLVCNICKIVCHLQGIQRPGIILALSLIVLTFVIIVRQWRDPKTRSLYAQQPEYILPRLPEVHWKLHKYEYLHITDTQQRSQQRPL